MKNIFKYKVKRFLFLFKNREYNLSDIKLLLKLPKKHIYPNEDVVYSKEFQNWFRKGVRRCQKHPYLVEWHIMERLDCPKCDNDRQ